jgi:hypothetical protein
MKKGIPGLLNLGLGLLAKLAWAIKTITWVWLGDWPCLLGRSLWLLAPPYQAQGSLK